MSTSIRDLLTAANDELDTARTRGSAIRAGTEALTTISAAAPILARLQRDRHRPDLDGIREHAIGGLAIATRHVATSSNGLPDGRAAQLLATAGDIVGTLQTQLGRKDRWALALAIADTVRRATTLYDSAGPSAPNNHVDWARGAAVVLARLGAEQPPEPRQTSVEDRPVPDPLIGRASTALAAAAQAFGNVTDLLGRNGEPMVLYQIKATTLLTETAARYLTAVAATATDGTEPWRAAPQAWGRVRQEIGVLHDGQRVRADGSDRLLGWAARAHDNIVRGLGPADQISGKAVAALSSTDQAHVLEIAHQLPTVAAALCTRLREVDRHAFARIADLPKQERRISDQIRGQPVIVVGPDLANATGALRSASNLSAHLAAELPDRFVVTAACPSVRNTDAFADRDLPSQRLRSRHRSAIEQGRHGRAQHGPTPSPGR